MDIAVTDSGMGGLFVVKKLLERTRAGKILYFADNAHAPYGRLSELRLQKVMRANCARLKDLGAKTIVLACNTATAVCIDELRAEFSDIEFVGTEPAIKPAAARYDKLTVMATPLTLKQPRFAALLKASGAKVNTPDCSRLAHLVEYGLPDLKRAKAEAERDRIVGEASAQVSAMAEEAAKKILLSSTSDSYDSFLDSTEEGETK